MKNKCEKNEIELYMRFDVGVRKCGQMGGQVGACPVFSDKSVTDGTVG